VSSNLNCFGLPPPFLFKLRLFSARVITLGSLARSLELLYSDDSCGEGLSVFGLQEERLGLRVKVQVPLRLFVHLDQGFKRVSLLPRARVLMSGYR